MKLLIEIGVEELPAIPFLKELKNIAPKWMQILENYGLKSEFDFEYTPRRLVFFHKDFKQNQDDKDVEFIGAPKSVAIKDGVITQAGLSFAKKCGISSDELGFKEINGKEVLYHKITQKGKSSKEVLPTMIDELLKSLNFGKSMRWGNGEFEFIRPIRNIICVLDNEKLDFEIYGVKSKMAFYPHRSFGYDLVEFSSIEEYFEKLEKNGVILSEKLRREKILNEFSKIENSSGLKIEIDNDLLDEVVAITESPKALLGEFEKEFLEVPKEVIITSMKENQRYFPVFKNENLSNHFIVVSNAISDDDALIIKGNEKVLRARLSDAMFFYKSDLSSDFSSEKLKNVTYMKELGSIYDKEIRELEIAKVLSLIYKDNLLKEFNNNSFDNELEKAIMLSKADLTSGMVGEFSELQGIMGGYYAKAKGEHELVAKAISEQYLPNGENSALPSSVFSSVVALSSKLDALMALFSIDKIPNGNKDPYALRRAANGVLKIVLDKKLKFDIDEILSKISNGYKKFDLQKLSSFIKDRLFTMYDINPSIIKACINSNQSDVNKLNDSILALDKIVNDDNFRENFVTFKRLSNIIKDEKISDVNEGALQDDAEKNLFAKFSSLNLDENNVYEYLNSLFGLKSSIDEFFDKVMINVDDEKIRSNRINLIGQIYKSFLKIADIKEISL